MLNALWTVARSWLIATVTDRNMHHPQCQTRTATPTTPHLDARCNCNGRGVRMP